MTPEAFTYWLQGFFELTDSKELSAAQVEMIKDHLKLVFIRVTPTTPAVPPIMPRLPDSFYPWNPRVYPYEVTCGQKLIC